MSARLEFKDVGRTFNAHGQQTQALAGISLELEPGAFTAVVGPSGCGKTTLLHIAAGLDTQYTGSFERSPANLTQSCLFQSPRLLPWLTARGNVAFVLESRGVGKREARQRATAMLDVVGLAKFTNRYPAQLSGGMQQRVALARALVVDPQLLLMDEPFASLDELTARQMRQELIELCLAAPRTIVFITHHIYEACFLADRIVVMSAHPGRVTADIDVEIERPRRYEDPRLSELAAHVVDRIDAGRATDTEVPAYAEA